MSDIDYLEIKFKLESHRCIKHGRYPTVTQDGYNINVKACCNEFQETLNNILKDEVKKALLKNIKDALG